MVLNLYENLARPVFMVENKHHYCLLDTGALFPVWCSSADALHVRYPDSYATKDILPLSGFGGKGELAPVYIIPEFKISKENDCIIFENLPVAVSQNVKSKMFHMIIPVFLFRESFITLRIKGSKSDRLQIDSKTGRQIICKIQYLVKDKMVMSIEGHNVVEKLICFTQMESTTGVCKSSYRKEDKQ